MRFTKIPLIATLMAVALSLLIVLPGLAQTGDRTDGKQSVGNVTVGVFDNIPDAQLGKLVASGQNDRQNNPVFIPVTTTPAAISGVTTADQHSPGDPAYLQANEVSPQDTLFRNTLYASSGVSAYNTVLVNFRHSSFGTAGFTFPANCVAVDGTAGPDATYTATVRNTRSTDSITIELVGNATPTGDYQAFFKIVHPDTPDYDPDTATDDDEIAYRQHDGPTWCANTTADFPFDLDGGGGDLTATDLAPRETIATSAVDNPVDMTRPTDGTGALPAVQEIATIFAKHGDRLTITTSGSSGVVDLVVDGDGPEFTAVTPADNAVMRQSRLTFSFEVRDDDSGLRHDGESVISSDGDYEEVNPDGDQNLASEPLSEDTSGSAVSRNGSSQDIQVNVKVNPRDSDDTVAYDEISASGTWRMAGSRAGVAYAFTASGSGRGDNEYLYQLVAKDRAGNTSMTDAETDSPNTAEPFVFRVDDIDPELADVRTGIGYDTAKNEEKVDRSYVALTFGGGDGLSHGLGEVDTSNITVVGHTIVGVIHPSKAPVINRGESEADASGTIPHPGDAPDEVAMPSVSMEVTLEDASTATLTPAGSCTITVGTGDTPTAQEVIDATITVITTSGLGTDETDPAIAYCALWTAYQTYLNAKNTHDTNSASYNNYLQFMRENPGKEINETPAENDDRIPDPRARVYLELAEDLAADAKPDVVVVGGAVFDLAGNTNEADTVRAEDWIAPSLTVTVTGTANDRPVANEDGSFTVDVRSDEDMRRRPDVYFVSLTAVTNDADEVTGYRIGTPSKASSLTQQEDENHWAKKYKASTIGEVSAIYGVIVLGEDGNDNAGATAGWTVSTHRNSAAPAASNGLNLTKMHDAGLLLEIDEEFNNSVTDGLGSVTPRSNEEGTETESANPFVKLEFAGEKDEYSVGAFKDTHDKVTVTEITLDGDNVMENLNRVSASSFSLITRDLAVGDYDVAYTAEDDAGNEYEGEFSFEVKARQAYKISVQPGWNLVSLPATPLDPAIGSVLSGNQYITPVLGYQDGDWITAIQQDDGTWRGRLEEITGGYGYWVHARTFTTVSTMLAEVDPAATLPTVPVTAGWNLLGVLDIFQNAAGEAPGEAGDNGDEADNYLGSIPWRVAYTYDTTASLWVKSTPKNPARGEGEDPEIANGNGYWVWSPTPSTLVP